MIHPGMSDKKLSKLDSAIFSRDNEFTFFKSLPYLSILKNNNITLQKLSNFFLKEDKQKIDNF